VSFITRVDKSIAIALSSRNYADWFKPSEKCKRQETSWVYVLQLTVISRYMSACYSDLLL